MQTSISHRKTNYNASSQSSGNKFGIFFKNRAFKNFNAIGNYVYVSVSMCLYVDLKAGAEYIQEKVVEFSGSAVTGICD